MKAVYIHIPFCHYICTYCDFCKLYYNKILVKKYLEALEKEIREKYANEEIETIYIGGGTPSSLDLEELEMLLSILNIFNRSGLKEYTIECNVESVTREKLQLFKEKGINRLSIGVQSFNDKLLKLLGRNHSRYDVVKIIQECREVGIENISIDMIYGIYGESLNDLKDDMETFLHLNLPHVSFYSLIIEPHTKLYIKNFDDIDEELNEKMYNYIRKKLKENGYNQYEISNFSKDGYQSRHNLVYWHNEQYYGFGLGASSYIGNVRYKNTRNITKYFNGFYKFKEDILTKREIMENEMILGLRLNSGVNKQQFYDKYNKNVEDVFDIGKLLQSGSLREKNNFLYIPEDKIFISNSILLEFID